MTKITRQHIKNTAIMFWLCLILACVFLYFYHLKRADTLNTSVEDTPVNITYSESESPEQPSPTSYTAIYSEQSINLTPTSWPPPSYKKHLTDEQLDHFILGRSFFTIPWVSAPSSTTSRDGLGPLFNSNTCESCHLGRLNTKADFSQPNNLPRSLVFKLGQPKNHDKRGKNMIVEDPVYGGQIAINGVKGVPFEAKVGVTLQTKKVTLAGGEEVELIKPTPILSTLNYGKLHKETTISMRQAPALHGLGLIERVPKQAILANADPNDKNKDGISGKANKVFDPVTQSVQLGLFGHKASQASLLSQTADAAINDMGLTNPIHPEEFCTPSQIECINAPKGRAINKSDPDLTPRRLNAIAYFTYNQMLPTKGKNGFSELALKGKALFNDIGCQSCHVSTLPTIDGKNIASYSDFLLHDLGSDLADNRPEFLATGQEWRTAPLWQTGVKSKMGNNFLHDARARNTIEAILWHGGEASKSRDKFTQLPKEKRKALLAFLDEL